MHRNDVIDSFRAVAILLVTGFHISGWVLYGSGVSFTGITTFASYGQFDAIGIIGNGWIGVGMFFVISGYCMAGSVARKFSSGMTVKSYAGYILNRLMRIGLPYYVSILVWVVLINEFGVTSKSTGIKDIITHLFFLHNTSSETMYSISGVFWSLAVEMQFYIILPVIFIFCKSPSVRLVTLLLSYLLSLFVNELSGNIVLTWGIPSYLCLFLMGWILSTSSSAFKEKCSGLFILLPCLFAFIILLCYKGNNYNIKLKIYEILISTVFSMLMISCVARFKNHKRNFTVGFLSFIGRCSFSIYLYNYIFWCLKPGVNSATSIVSAYLLVLAFGVAMHFIIERNTERLRRHFFSSNSCDIKLK